MLLSYIKDLTLMEIQKEGKVKAYLSFDLDLAEAQAGRTHFFGLISEWLTLSVLGTSSKIVGRLGQM